MKRLRLKIKKLIFNLNHSIGIACNTKYMGYESDIFTPVVKVNKEAIIINYKIKREQ